MAKDVEAVGAKRDGLLRYQSQHWGERLLREILNSVDPVLGHEI